MLRRSLTGLAAGAAGTTALNAVTYLDMVWRGRPASETPAQTVEWAAAATGLDIPGDDDVRPNRTEALGSLSGIATGLGVGAAYGVAHELGHEPPMWVGALLASAGALVGSNVPMSVAGITDPRTWSAMDWASDIVPHLVYGVVVAATFAATES